MANVSDLLSSALGTNPSPVPAFSGSAPAPVPTPVPTPLVKQAAVAQAAPEKQAEVAAASDSKKVDMGGLPDKQTFLNAAIARRTGSGLSSANPVEKDLATLGPDQIIQKYGPEVGQGMLIGLNQAGDAYDGRATSTPGSMLKDAALGLGQGAIAIGGLATVPLAAADLGFNAAGVNTHMGVSTAQMLKNASDYVGGFKSIGLQNQTSANEDRTALDMRDNAAAQDTQDQGIAQQYVADKANGDSDFVAGAKIRARTLAGMAENFGSDAYDAVKNTVQNPALLADNTAQFVGSLIGAGPTGKTFGALSKAIVPEATRLSIGSEAAIARELGLPSVSRAADAIGKALPNEMLTSMGAVEGSSTYQNTSTDIANTDPAELAKTSPMFRELVAGGMSPEDARYQVANRAGLLAAAVAAPLSMGVAKATSIADFEKHPFSLKSFAHAGADLLKETVHEGGLGATDTLSENIGKQQTANPNQDLGEGVAQQTGLAALGGFGSAAITQAPSLTGTPLKMAGKAALSGAGTVGNAALGLVGSAAAKAAAPVKAATEAASPVSDAQVAHQGAAVQATMSDPMAAVALHDAVQKSPDFAPIADKITQLGQFDPEEIANSTLPEPVKKQLAGSANRVDMLQKLANIVNDKGVTTQEGLSAASYLHDQIGKYQALTESDPAGFEALPDDHVAGQINEQFNQLADNIRSNPTVSKALTQVSQLTQDQVEKLIQPVTQESLHTPEGQQNIANAATIASEAPDKGNLEANKAILAHVENGEVKLEPDQLKALQSSVAIMQASREGTLAQQAAGHESPMGSVTQDILTRSGAKANQARSATSYALRIFQSVRSGDIETAKAHLADFGDFVQHMQNKAAALNQHYENGGGAKVSNLAINPESRAWYQTKGNFAQSVNPTNAKSVEYAQRVSLEAKQVSDIYNGLSKAFPELEGGQSQSTPLTKNLQGKVQDVLAEHKAGTRVQPSLVPNADRAPKPVPAITRNEKSVSKTEATPVLLPEQNQGAEEEKTKPQSEADATPAKTSQTEKSTEAQPEELSKDVKTSEGAEEAPKTIQEAYPNLHQAGDGPVKNWFEHAYKATKEISSRIFGDHSPVETVKNALRSNDARVAFVGEDKIRGTLTKPMIRTVQAYLDFAPQLIDTLNERFNAKLGEKGLAERLVKGEPLNRWTELKASNLVEQQEDGSFKYNPAIAGQAVLAGLQWLLVSNNYRSDMDADLVSALTGIPSDQAERHVGMLDVGLSPVEAVRSLASKIVDFWGVQKNPNVDKAYTDGIAQAMATEVLRALEETVIDKSQPKGEQGLLQRLRFVIDGDSVSPLAYGEETKKRTLQRLVSNLDRGNASKDTQDPLFQNPNLIEQTVLTEPKERDYYADDKIPVAKTQMRNLVVPLTSTQRSMIKVAQGVEHFLNMELFQLYNALGEKGLLSLFGAGDTDRPLNAQHKLTLEGQNQTIRSAWRTLSGRVADMNTFGQELGKIPMRYAFNVSSVGRLQMLGADNPQASKLVREIVLPTWSTLDLTDPDQETLFKTAIAQALGVKIHANSTETNLAKVEAQLNGAFAGTLQLLTEHLNDERLPDGAIERIQSEFQAAGEDLTPNALHALQEWARSQTVGDKGRTAFRTGIYLEADGVTNGIVNAIHMLTTTGFTGDQIGNLAKGGMFFNGPTTMNEHRAGDSVDLYSVAANKLQSSANSLYRNAPEAVKTQADHLYKLMNLLLPKVDFDLSTGTLSVDRGVTKNPMTITVYGSGANGIAAKITDMLAEQVYERLSRVAGADKEVSFAEAMFGDSTGEGHDDRLDAFDKALNGILTTKVGGDPSGGKALSEINPEKFVFDKKQMASIQEHVLSLFVDPMRDGITETLGQSFMDSTKLVQRSTQAQSIVLEHLFTQKVKEAVAQRAENDPTWRKGDFLSENALKGILQDLLKTMPLIDTGEQRFFPVKNNTSEFDQILAKSLDGKLGTPAEVNGPSDSGVKGGAMLNIGMGDGAMIQHMLNNGARGLPVFDGFNFALDHVLEGSQKANEAASESWKGNPLRAVLESFEPFLKSISSEMLDKNEKMKDALIKALFPQAERKNATSTGVIAILEGFRDELSDGANVVDARHQVLGEHQFYVDQMAGAQSPYLNKGIPLSGSPEEIASKLNNRLAEVLKAKSDKPALVVMTPTDLDLGIAQSELSADQQDVWQHIKAAGGLDGYRILSGTRAQIDEYRANNNLPAIEQTSLKSAKGLIDPGSKMIYLVGSSAETMLHEAVHAATFNTILTHYEGGDLGKRASEITGSVNRLEALMRQFLSPEFSEIGVKAGDSFFNASKAVRDALAQKTPLGKATALNEFMAWTLANKELTGALKNTQATGLAKIASDVWQAIKTLVFGKNQALHVGDDMFSNLLFNSAVVMQAQPTIADLNRSVTLFQNPSYGTDDRLSALNVQFDKIFGRFMNVSDPVQATNRSIAVQQASVSSFKLANLAELSGFNGMSLQAHKAFHAIVQALSLEMSLSPTSMAIAEGLFRHAMKQLTPDMLIDQSDPDRVRAESMANSKFNFLLGNLGTETDKSGRSSLLPVFMALATVDDDFRDALSFLDLPKSEKSHEKGSLSERFEARLSNLAQQGLDSLSDRMGGVGNSKNVQQAIDALTQHVAREASDTASLMSQINQIASAPNKGINILNDGVVNLLDRASDVLLQGADKVKASTSNSLVQKGAEAVKLFANMATAEKARGLQEWASGINNNVKGWKPLTEAVGEIIGRSASNASVYDMIKTVRAIIQNARQQFVDHVPQMFEKQFTQRMTKTEWSALHMGVAKTDLSALTEAHSHEDVLKMLSNPKARSSVIQGLETQLEKEDPRYWALVKAKAEQLATHMTSGAIGRNLLRNADAIARLLGENHSMSRPAPTEAYVKALDQLISLYALNKLAPETQAHLSSLVQSEAEGMKFVLAYVNNLRLEEKAKSLGMAKFNSYKGFVPMNQKAGMSIVVAKDSDSPALLAKSMIRIADYKGSKAEGNHESKGYYYQPAAGRAAFTQGTLQSIHHTAGGVDLQTGQTTGVTAGLITNPVTVDKIARQLSREGKATSENLVPLYNDSGKVVAFERSVDPSQLARLGLDDNLARMAGVWRGRQVEEAVAHKFNTELIDKMHEMYKSDIQKSAANKSQYVNLFDPKSYDNDAPTRQAVSLMSPQTKAYIKSVFGNKFMVRRDMINDSIGYHKASIGDAWTGNSRWSPETLDVVKNISMAIWGNKAYANLVNSEGVWKEAVKEVKSIIMIKSLLMPAVNLAADTFQLMGRGVPLATIAKSTPQKLSEINAHVKGKLRKMDAEGELFAAQGAKNYNKVQKLKAEIQSINDSDRRLSIWPLIKAGEFGMVADVGNSRGDLALTGGRLQEFMEGLTSKLPEAVRTAGNYALIGEDTPLYQGIQKSMEYGDFIMKALYYDHLMKKPGMTSQKALGEVSEEFVNFDRSQGRFRGSLEELGLAWFYNYKLRSAKIALSVVRDNPVHTLLGSLGPFSSTVGVENFLGDNVFGKALEGNLLHSIGPGMMLRAPMMHPLAQLLH